MNLDKFFALLTSGTYKKLYIEIYILAISFIHTNEIILSRGIKTKVERMELLKN